MRNPLKACTSAGLCVCFKFTHVVISYFAIKLSGKNPKMLLKLIKLWINNICFNFNLLHRNFIELQLMLDQICSVDTGLGVLV